MTLNTSLPEPSISYDYSTPGRGDLDWRPFQRRSLEQDFKAVVNQIAERWLERLLTAEEQAETIVVDIPHISAHVSVDLNQTAQAAERMGRTLAGAILREVYRALGRGHGRHHWPAIDDFQRLSTEGHLERRVAASHQMMAAAQTAWLAHREAEHERIRGEVLGVNAAAYLAMLLQEIGSENLPAGLEAAFTEALQRAVDAPVAQRWATFVDQGNALSERNLAFMRPYLRLVGIAHADFEAQWRGYADQEARGGFASEAHWRVHHAACEVRSLAGASFPLMLLPPGVPDLSDYSAPQPGRTWWGAARAQAPEVDTASLRVARLVASAQELSSVAQGYHLLEEQQVAWLHGSDPEDILAGQLLTQYLRAEKERWAHAFLRRFMERPVERPELDWSLSSCMRYLDGPLPANFDPPSAGADPSEPGTLNPAKRWKLAQIRARVERAWARIQQWVAPELLAQVPPCYVIFATKETRAHHSSSNGHSYMLITSDNHEDVIMHEFGHHLEEHLPHEVWYRAARMIQERSGQEDLVGIRHPADWEVGSRAEVGVRSRRYATRYYGGSLAATEVVSMGIEALSDPAAAFELYVNDPQHLALILASFGTSFADDPAEEAT